jgi:uncharacterized membrane protein YoaK (UPF0700 family)
MIRFEHSAFILGLGFVAGAMDAFGFIALHGLLPAHVTGNLVFIAIDLGRGQSDIGMKLAAVPIFVGGVAGAAWFIGRVREGGENPFRFALALQACLIAASLVGWFALPPVRRPDDLSAVVVGSFALLAMALQNVTMRLILNNMPPTTVMTGNITQVVSDTVAFAFEFRSMRGIEHEGRILSRQAVRMALTLSGFAAGALAAALGYRVLGGAILVAPIAALIGLIPFERAAARASIASTGAPS